MVAIGDLNLGRAFDKDLVVRGIKHQLKMGSSPHSFWMKVGSHKMEATEEAGTIRQAIPINNTAEYIIRKKSIWPSRRQMEEKSPGATVIRASHSGLKRSVV